MNLTKRKGFNFFRSYYDVYNELDDKSKVDFMDALLHRQFLGIEPEGLKGMANFAYISQAHSINKQVKGYEDKTGIKLLHPPTVGGKKNNLTPTEQVQGKGKGEVQGKEKEKEKVQDVKEKFVFRKSLLNYGFEENLVRDWLLVRSKKKSANTETAFKIFISNVGKSSYDKNVILKKCVEKSWISYKHTWKFLEEPQQNKNNSFNKINID